MKLLEDNGLLDKSEEANIETRGAAVEEAKNLWKKEQKGDKYYQESQARTLEELIDELLGKKLLTNDEKDIILGNEEKGIAAEYKVTIGSRTIVFENHIYIGDYVNYVPQQNITSYSIEAKYSGYDTDQTFSQSSSLKWRVFDFDDENVLLISEQPIKKRIYLQAFLGYNNGVYILNDYAKTLYSNLDYQAEARSINIEDFQNVLDLDYWDYHNYYKYGTTRYTDEDMYYGKYVTYPYLWSLTKTDFNANKIDDVSIKGSLGQSEQFQLTTEEEQKVTSLTCEQTYWGIGRDNLTEDNFKTADTRNIDETKSFYYNILAKNMYYWIASRYTSLPTDSTYNTKFGIRFMNERLISGIELCNTYPNTDEWGDYLRVIVNLPYESFNLSDDYDESNGGWSLISY